MIMCLLAATAFQRRVTRQPSLQPVSVTTTGLVLLHEELVMTTVFQQKHSVDGRCQNVAELTGGTLL
jgi:hypothetical protein